MIKKCNLYNRQRYKILFITLSFLCLSPFGMTYDIPFSRIRLYLDTEFSYKAIAVDLDTDSYPDILYDIGSKYVYWRKNTGENSTFLPEEEIYINFPRIACDLDGDLDMDLISKSSWYENVGFPDNAFTSHTLPFISTDLYTIDFDKDSDIDIIAVNKTQTQIVFMENNGQSPPAFTVNTLVNCSGNPDFIKCIDMDHDEDIDLVTVLKPDNQITWYENQVSKEAGFIEHPVYLANEEVKQMDVKDINGDGFKDIIVIVGHDRKLIWYKNMDNQSSVFKPRYVHPFDKNKYSIFNIKDLDRDGDLDIVESGILELGYDDYDRFCQWSENIGENEEGDPEYVTHSFLEHFDVSCIFITDIDLDKDLDVIINDQLWRTWASASFIWLYKNNTTLLINSPHFTDVSGDGVIQPGEPGKLEFELEAPGSFSNIVGTLISTSPYIEFSSNTLSIGDMDMGEKRSCSVDYTTSNSAGCGDIIGADLHFSWDGNHKDAKCEETIFGKLYNGHKTKSENPQESIPDNDTDGLTRILHINALNAVTTKLDISFNIEHSLPSDLTVTLTAPNGNTATIFHDPNYMGPNLVGSYSVNGFVGTETGGDYTLKIVDSYPYDTGQLLEWSIDVEYVYYQCRTWDKDKILQYILGYYEEEDIDKMDTNVDQDINISDFIYSLNY